MTVTGTLISIYFRLESLFFAKSLHAARSQLKPWGGSESRAKASSKEKQQQKILEPRHVIFLLNYILNEL